jgi:hypothetical protein
MKHNNLFIFLIVSAIIISLYLILKNEIFNKNKEHFVVDFEIIEQSTYSPENINIYEINEIPIAGAAGLARKKNPKIPKIGFKPDEVENLKVKIISENGLKYVENNSMVPYLHSQIKYLTKHLETMQEQFNKLAEELEIPDFKIE